MTGADRLQRIVDGRTDLVHTHITEGGAATDTDQHGVRLIEWCAYYGDVSAIRFLLVHGESLAALGDNLGLHGAAFHGHWQLCQFQLESGADPNQALPDTGETPLHAALSQPNRPAYNLVVQLLLAHGADPNTVTTPDVETGDFMRDCRTKGESPLHRAAAFGDEQVITWLLEAGAQVDARDAHGDSPLGWASWAGRPQFILDLLTFDDHAIHPEAVARSRNDARSGWDQGMKITLLGKPHIP